MDLSGPGGDFAYNNTSWGHLLRLASTYGWEPAGTRPPKRCRTWDGNYVTNDGQRVTAADARRLADALEKALPDLPDHDALEHKKKRVGQSEEFGIPWQTPTNPFEWFSGAGKERLRTFIAYCRAGGFTIR
jgi:hypothetical protein